MAFVGFGKELGKAYLRAVRDLWKNDKDFKKILMNEGITEKDIKALKNG